MSVRVGEVAKNWFRSDRFQHVNNDWFFITREMTEEGPYKSRKEAEIALSRYILKQEPALKTWFNLLLSKPTPSLSREMQ